MDRDRSRRSVETAAAVEIETPIPTAAWKVQTTFHRFHRPLIGRREESRIDAGHESDSVLHLIAINTLPKGSIRFRFPFGRNNEPRWSGDFMQFVTWPFKSKNTAPGRPGESCLDF